MTAAIAVVYDPTYVRFRLDLTGWSADGPVTVTGTGADGSVWPVRSVTAVSGGVTSGYDTEMPFNVGVTYTAYDGATLVTSGVATVPLTQPFLRSPGLPSLDVAVEVLAKPQVSRPRDQVVLRPLGRRTGIPIAGALSAGAFTLTVRTRDDDDAEALEDLLAASPTVLLIMPGSRLAREYVATSGLDEAPMVDARAATGYDVGYWASWAIPCTVVDSPAGGVFGDPTASYQAGLDAYPTYQASKTAEPTYLDRLKA